MMFKNITLLQLLRYGLIISIIFNGFFYNFFNLSILPDIFGLSIIFLLLFSPNGTRIHIESLTIVLLILFISIVFISLISMYSFDISLKSLRSYVFMALYGVFGFTSVKEKERKKLFDFIIFAGSILGMFSIIQYIFYDVLPDNFLAYGTNLNVFMNNGMRVNGLMPNSICLGLFTVIVFVLILSKIVYKDYKNHIIYLELVIVIFALFLTYGRMAVFGMLFSFFMMVFILNKKITFKKFLFVIIAFVAVCVAYTKIDESELLMRLFNKGGETIASNQMHQDDFEAAFKEIIKSPIFGVGFGTQGYNRGDLNTIITDGTWFTLMLELGIPITLIFLVALMFFFNKSIKFYRTDLENRRYFSIIITLIPFMMINNYFNSSFLYDTNYCLIWIIFGLTFDLFIKTNKSCSYSSFNQLYIF